jgi:hypothetical protein
VSTLSSNPLVLLHCGETGIAVRNTAAISNAKMHQSFILISSLGSPPYSRQHEAASTVPLGKKYQQPLGTDQLRSAHLLLSRPKVSRRAVGIAGIHRGS